MPIQVQTTQNVVIDYEPAGLGYRILAYLIDLLVILVWLLGWLGVLWGILGSVVETIFDSFNFFSFILTCIVIVPVVFYDFLAEVFNNGQSLGKMALKIRVVNVDGTVPSAGSLFLRWLFRILDILVSNGLVGVISIAVSSKGQRLGDIVAGTTVISLKLESKNALLRVPNLDFQDSYMLTYPDILDRLSDNDFQSIMSVMDNHNVSADDYFSKRLAERISAVTGYTYEGSDTAFLKRLVSDYNYLAVRD